MAQKIQSFVMLIPSSIMQSMAAIVSQNVGAGKEKRADQAMRCGILFGAAVGVVIAYAAFFHGDALAGLFTEDAAVVKRAFEFLRGFAPEAIVTSILFSYMGYFNGHAKSLFVMIQGLAQSFLIRLPMSYLMSIRPNASLFGVGLAAPSATVSWNYSVHNLLCAYEKANERKACLNKTLRFPHTTHTVFLWKSGGFLI